MIKVLHVVTRLNVGGLTTFLYNYYKHIDRTKIRFDFVAIDTGEKHVYHDKLTELGGEVFYMPDPFLARASYFCKLLKKQKYTVVHAHIETQSAIYLLLAKIMGVKVRISHAHWSRENVGFTNKVLKFILNRVVSLRAGASEIAIEAVVGKKHIKNSRVIHNSVDLEHFKFDEDLRAQYRRELEIQDQLVLGFVGRLTAQKNVPFLVNVLDALTKQRKDVVLLLVGGGEDEAYLKKELSIRKLESHVQWLGERNDVNKLMCAMDILLLPSHYEGLPLVLVEAQAASLFSIVSDQITRQVELSQFILYRSILDNDENIWVDQIEKVGNNYARASTSDDLKNAGFDIKTEAQKLLELYKDLISKNN